MGDDEQTLSRKVGEAVQNDSSLVGRVAVAIARALNLEGNNKTLGRNFIRLALTSDTIDTFKEKSMQYGNIRKEVLVEIYHDVKQKYNNMLIQLRDNSDSQGESIFGFSGQTETLRLPIEGGAKGGLLKAKGGHVFRRPENSQRQGSVLGLDRDTKTRHSVIVPSTEGDEEGMFHSPSVWM